MDELTQKMLETKSENNDAAAAFIVKEGKVLLGLKYTLEDFLQWSPPGGRCINSETYQETLKKKIKQEVGITDFKVIRFLGTTPGKNPKFTIYIFECTTDQDYKNTEKEAFLKWKYFDLQRIPGNFINPYALKFLTLYPVRTLNTDQNRPTTVTRQAASGVNS